MDVGPLGQESLLACSPLSLFSLPRSRVIPWLPHCGVHAFGTERSEALWKSSMRGVARRELNLVAAFFLPILTVCASFDYSVSWAVPLAIPLRPGRAPDRCHLDVSLTDGSFSLEVCHPFHTALTDVTQLCSSPLCLFPATKYILCVGFSGCLLPCPVGSSTAQASPLPGERQVLFCHLICLLSPLLG